MQTGDPTKPTNLTGTDPSRLDLTSKIRPRSTLFLAQICLNSANLAQIYSNSAKTPVSLTLTRPNLVRSRPNFHRSEGISAKSRYIRLRSGKISAKIWQYRKT